MTDKAAEALAEARSLVAHRDAEHNEAQQTDAALIARLERGDDSVTTADLNEVGNPVTRARILRGHASPNQRLEAAR